ncbi:hypothetical protein FQR65_LT04003 [Abscondita terminalis]|nr:hypothetical protein FQR65_LT04003 [Abscondita terminalis]
MKIISVSVILVCVVFIRAEDEDYCINKHSVSEDDVNNYYLGNLQDAAHLADYLCCELERDDVIMEDGTVSLATFEPYAEEQDEIKKINECKEIKKVTCDEKDKVVKLSDCIRDFFLMMETEE